MPVDYDDDDASIKYMHPVACPQLVIMLLKVTSQEYVELKSIAAAS